MSEALADFVLAHVDRGECQCGLCFDKGDRPDPIGHTVDLTVFKIAAKDNPDRDTFVRLTKSHQGIYNQVDVFDGKEHGFIELGGWLGDQGLALMFIGLGTLLGVFQLLSPETVMPWLQPDMKMQMATSGYVTIQAKPAPTDFSKAVKS